MNNGLYGNPKGRLFTSSLFPIAAGAIANATHGLGGPPQWVRWVFVCIDIGGEAGYALGDELDITGVIDSATGLYRFATGANGSAVWITAYTGLGTQVTYHKSTGAVTNLTLSKWRAKAYAQTLT